MPFCSRVKCIDLFGCSQVWCLLLCFRGHTLMYVRLFDLFPSSGIAEKEIIGTANDLIVVNMCIGVF